MAKKALINKQRKQPKYRVRAHTRCARCGRSRAVYKRLSLAALAIAAQRGVPPETIAEMQRVLLLR